MFTLSSFQINGKNYALLHDIQLIFNLRALIAQLMEEEQDWFLQDPKLKKINICFNPKEALRFFFEEAMDYKAQVLSKANLVDTQILISDLFSIRQLNRSHNKENLIKV